MSEKPTKHNETSSGTDEHYTLEVSDQFQEAVDHGVTFDRPNYRRLTFWSLFGTFVILVMIVGIMYVYKYSFTSIGQQQSAASQFYNIQEVKQQNEEKLSSFGVVDPDAGIYRIPIDSAITLIATDFD